ncbi:unnamed protein product [Clavelina lepadiformis]|uniref:Ribosomal protein L27 n=1 Tax=Clavelina lepadiformis TaxID=159417 RepID=A0ABP0FZP7_CLALP
MSASFCTRYGFVKYNSASSIIKCLVPKDSPAVIQTCYASTGQKGYTRNKNITGHPKHRGWKVQEGDTVHQGYILATQIHKFRWHPGANVAVGRNKTLNATCSGTVRFTKEIFIPNPSSALAEAVATFPRGAFLYKTTINIVPRPDIGRFRLVETV